MKLFASNMLVKHLTTLCLLAVTTASQAENSFMVSADGNEVFDAKSNLSWRRCAEGMEWDGKACSGTALKLKLPGAKAQAASQSKAADKTWRVPTKAELTTLLDKSKKGPMIDSMVFPNTPSALFWSLRPDATDDLNAWMVNFGNGHVYGNTGQGKFNLRLVRTGK